MEFSAFVLIPTQLSITHEHRQKSCLRYVKTLTQNEARCIYHGVFGIDTNHDIFSLNTFRPLTPMLTFRAFRRDFELQSKIFQCFRYTIEVVQNHNGTVKTQDRLKSESGQKV